MSRHLFPAALLAALFLTVPATADPTPALPFWSRPFPAGYVRRHVADEDSSVGLHRRCAVRERIRAADGRIVVVWRPCRPVLRVRD